MGSPISAFTTGGGLTELKIKEMLGKTNNRKNKVIDYPELGTFYKTIGGSGNVFYESNPRIPRNRKKPVGAEGLTSLPYNVLENNFSRAIEKVLGGKEDYVPFSSWYQDYLNKTYLPSLYNAMKGGKQQLSLLYKKGVPKEELATWGPRGEGQITYDRRRALIDALNAYAIEFGLMPKENIKYGRGPGISGLV